MMSELMKEGARVAFDLLGHELGAGEVTGASGGAWGVDGIGEVAGLNLLGVRLRGVEDDFGNEETLSLIHI